MQISNQYVQVLVVLIVACFVTVSSVKVSSLEQRLSNVLKLKEDPSVLAAVPTYDKEFIGSVLKADSSDDVSKSLLEVESQLSEAQGSKRLNPEKKLPDLLTENTNRVHGARPEDQLPNMSPLDGLDVNLLNPLHNPKRFVGPNQFLKDFPDKDYLPSTGTVMNQLHAGGVRGTSSTLTPGSVLPPIVNTGDLISDTTPGVSDSIARKYEDVHPSASPLPSAANIAPTWHDNVLSSSPYIGHDSLDPQMRVPFVVEHPYIYKDYKPVAPVYANVGAAPFPPMVPGAMHPDMNPQAQTREYVALQHEKRTLEMQRQHALASVNKRKSQISYLQSYVDGGEAWVNKMQDQWNKWIEAEKAKGSKSIEAEQHKVDQFKAQLKQLTDAQREDMERVNVFNSELRKAEVNYEIRQRQAKLLEAQEKQKKLEEELKKSKDGKASLEKDIAEYSARLAESKKEKETTETKPSSSSSSSSSEGEADKSTTEG